LTLAEGRTLEQKRGFYKRVVDDLHDRLGVRREDVFVSLVGTGREDWSFGNMRRPSRPRSPRLPGSARSKKLS
jgi:hypothetical protein